MKIKVQKNSSFKEKLKKLSRNIYMPQVVYNLTKITLIKHPPTYNSVPFGKNGTCGGKPYSNWTY